MQGYGDLRFLILHSMADTKAAYALAVELHQELQVHEHRYPELMHAIKLSDQLAREMGWVWVSDDGSNT